MIREIPNLDWSDHPILCSLMSELIIKKISNSKRKLKQTVVNSFEM